MREKTQLNNIEIEIQIQAENITNLLIFLEENGVFLGEKHQIDHYFTPAHRNFTAIKPINEWLRLRESSGKYSINYKNWHREKDGRSNYCDEYESSVESLEQLRLIFNALDIKPLVIVNKMRKLYRYQDYEIAIDSVEKLGDFVEIEYKGTGIDKDVSEITQETIAFLKKIGCGKILRNYQGYPYKLLFPKESTNEIF
jgi:adenylate cyclase, class 2